MVSVGNLLDLNPKPMSLLKKSLKLCKSMLISHGFVMFYDIFEQNGHRLWFIPRIRAKDQSALASAQRLILRFIASSRAFFFCIWCRVGRPPLFALRFLHSWFPTLNPIAMLLASGFCLFFSLSTFLSGVRP
jgi:hypothetical protein